MIWKKYDFLFFLWSTRALFSTSIWWPQKYIASFIKFNLHRNAHRYTPYHHCQVGQKCNRKPRESKFYVTKPIETLAYQMRHSKKGNGEKRGIHRITTQFSWYRDEFFGIFFFELHILILKRSFYYLFEMMQWIMAMSRSTKNEIVKFCIFCMIHACVRNHLTMRIRCVSSSIHLRVSLHWKLRVIWRTCRRSANDNNNRYGNHQRRWIA